jgi:hypothetical protein
MNYGVAAIVAVVTALVLAIGHGVMTSMRGRRSGVTIRRWSVLELLVYAVFVITTALLGVTAIWSMAAAGMMRGWFLWLHLSAAGAFVVVLAIMAVMWCAAGSAGNGEHVKPGKPVRFTPLGRACFWVILASGWVAMATILVNMWAYLGTHNQDRTVAIHRWAGLVLVVAAVLHLYSLLTARLGRR